MEDPDLNESQWELSKENIQPIKQGRKASLLKTALNESQHRKLSLEKQEFETALRSYDGDDPLDIWYQYALWIEQNFPKGGNEGKLTTLLECCFSTLGTSGLSDNRYKNDQRYFDLWQKYISNCPYPVEVYQTLSSKNMFTDLSAFFVDWALEMEARGNLKKANVIYLDGIDRKAQPIKNLETAYSKFQARFARLTIDGLIEGENCENEVQRKAFAALKPRGAKAKAPTERVSSVIGSAGRLSSSVPKANNASGPIFQIFQDENGPPCKMTLSDDPSSQNFMSQVASTKENSKAATSWNKKVRQKTTTNVPVEEVNRFNQPGFSVHADDTSESNSHAPVQKPTDLSGILCNKKLDKDDWHVPLFISEPFNPNVQPQYCKHQVYSGTEEFSFEELRAIAMKKGETRKHQEQQPMEVHVENTSESNSHVPAQKPTVLPGIVYNEKVDKDDWHVPLFIPEPFNPHAQPQYCKHLVYSGTEEFSFEELQAIAIKKKEEMKEQQKQQLMEAELRFLRDKVLQQEQQLSLLQNKIAEFCPSQTHDDDKRSTQITQPNPTILMMQDQTIASKKVPDSISRRRPLYEDSYVVINQSVNAMPNLSQASDELSDDASLLQPVVPTECQDTSLFLFGTKTDGEQHSSLIANTPVKESNRSVTLNTKFAQNLVHAMFNHTTMGTSQSHTAASFLVDDQVYPPKLDNPAKRGEFVPPPFVIFEDASDQGKVEAPPFSIYCDENADVAPSITRSVPRPGGEVKRLPLGQLTLDDQEEELKGSTTHVKPTSFDPVSQIYHDVNEAEIVKPTRFDPTSQIYYDVNGAENVRSPEKKPLASMACPDQSAGYSTQPLVGEVPLQDTSRKLICEGVLNDENQENIPPRDYAPVAEKRTLAGVLQPSTDIPFVPLEEQQKETELVATEDEMEGVAPLSNLCIGNDFTQTIPFDRETFVKMACLASTPQPASQGFVPQVVLDDDDFTMAAFAKSSKSNLDKEVQKNTLADVKPAADNDLKKRADLMTPSSVEVRRISSGPLCNREVELTTHNTNSEAHNQLSPIMEASREYRSSSSSGSCSSTVISAHGVTHSSHFTAGSALKSMACRSQRKRILSEGESHSGMPIYHRDTFKSGSFADIKESRNETQATSVSQNSMRTSQRKFDSFDPDKLASDLLMMDDDVREADSLSLKRPFQVPDRIGTQDNQRDSSTKEVQEDFLPLQRSIQYPPVIDPFCSVLQKRILGALKSPIEKRGGFVPLRMKMPQLRPKMRLTLGKELYQVLGQIGSGAYAQIYHATTVNPMNVTVMPVSDDDDDVGDSKNQMILKVQKPASSWEFYICHELRERLKQKAFPEDTLDAFMRVNRAYFLPQGSILVSQFHRYGTMLDIVNKYKERGKSMPQNLVFFFLSEIVLCLDALRSCSIIHGDLKPDNVLLVSVPSIDSDLDVNVPTSIKLIDFGRSIDMEVLPRGTEFTRIVKTEGFTCCEMRDGRPWTFQTDYYGLAAIAHVMLWGTYMNVKKEDNVWKIYGVNYHRYMNSYWQSFFHQMLNLPSSQELPDLKNLFQDLRSHFVLRHLGEESRNLEMILGRR